jgi:hypothetical protein
MSFLDMLSSHRNASRFLIAEAIATAICPCLVALAVEPNHPAWLPSTLWLLPITAVGSLLCFLQSLIPTPIHWGRTSMAALLLLLWCLVGRLYYAFNYGAHPWQMTKMW